MQTLKVFITALLVGASVIMLVKVHDDWIIVPVAAFLNYAIYTGASYVVGEKDESEEDKK